MSIRIDFDAAIAAVLDREDVKRALEQSDQQLQPNDLRASIAEDELEMRGLLAPMIEKYEEIEREIEAIRVGHELVKKPRGLAARVGTTAILLALIALGAAVGRLLGSDLVVNFVPALLSPDLNWQKSVTGVVLLFSSATVAARIAWGLNLPRRMAYLEDNPWLNANTLHLSLQEKAIVTKVEDLVTAAAFETIGRAGPPFFQAKLVHEGHALPPSSRLKISSAQGLSEVADKTHEAPTVARREIFNLLNELPGASIGLSGPRGAGKSTILRSLTAANLPLRGKRAIAVYTAAPVEYDARDFLLHLFATLCRQVLRTHDAAEDPDQAAARGRATEGREWLARLERVAPFLWLVGNLFTGFALIMSVPLHTASGSFGEYLASLDLKLGPLLLFGMSALLIAYAVRLYSISIARREGRRGGWLRGLYAGAFELARQRAEEHAVSPLVALSRQELRDIRFQRSFTAGWSGALKLPVGFELGGTSSTSLAQRQESLPELVDRFCRYVGRVTDEHGTVIIAVDELDKLKTAEEAEKFINSIKSIFAIPHCFYLVSVSEDALSAFERRGLSLRDAFDSAFDDIRYIGYKQLAGSRAMLHRRILDFPDPFLCLCHVLSGGLPRDLIRVARATFQAARKPGSATLTAIARRLVDQEAKAKIRASRTALRSIALEPEVGDFAAAMAELEEQAVGSAGYRATIKSLVAQPRESADAAAMAKLVAIQRELAAYLEFLGLTLKLARRLATREGWEESEKKDVERLARARQALEASVSVGMLQLDRVRVALGG